MILHLLLKSLFLSLRGFYLVQHTKLLQFASPFWTNKITGDLASPRFSPIWSFSNRIWACKPPIAWEVVSTSSTLKFQITLILSELNSDILVVAPLLQLNPSPTVALHQNGLVWSCIRATTIQTKLIEKSWTLSDQYACPCHFRWQETLSGWSKQLHRTKIHRIVRCKEVTSGGNMTQLALNGQASRSAKKYHWTTCAKAWWVTTGMFAWENKTQHIFGYIWHKHHYNISFGAQHQIRLKHLDTCLIFLSLRHLPQVAKLWRRVHSS